MKPRSRKKLWIALLCLVAAAAVGIGIWFAASGAGAEPVKVYPFYLLGMTEYWGDNQESYGPVTTDRIQTVFLSDTQTVTEILVKEGEQVKKGDLLLTFDTSLSELALERARLEVEKLKLQLEDAKQKLKEIQNMRPMRLPENDPQDSEDDNLGAKLTGNCLVSGDSAYDGSSPEKALICWVNSAAKIDSGIFDTVRFQAVKLQMENRKETETEGDGEAEPAAESVPEEETLDVTHFYVVIKITSGNREFGNKLTWQGLHVYRGESGYSFKFFNPTIPDHMLSERQEEEGESDFDYGSGYTSAQLAQMRADQEKQIRELELKVRMAEADYKLMKLEADDGNIYAQFDGQVVSLLSVEEAQQTAQPLLKLSGGGGFYVEGTVSELERENLEVGQEVTVMDWNTGMTYIGVIHSVGDFPSQEGYYNGMGNPNTTYYPFKVFVDGSADLQEGSYVSIQYASGGAAAGIYLENPFIRTEQGRSYVYVRGADGTLEKRFVTTGKALWGSYTEILSGITEEDYLAFPYGKQVRPGVPTEEGDLSDLYG